jgi:hypothetical protein
VHALERKVSVHERHIAERVDSMANLLTTPPAPSKRPIGFVHPQEKADKPAGKVSKKTMNKNTFQPLSDKGYQLYFLNFTAAHAVAIVGLQRPEGDG